MNNIKCTQPRTVWDCINDMSNTNDETHTYDLHTLDDVATELENSAHAMLHHLKKELTVSSDVMIFSDADADYDVAMLSLSDNVIIYSQRSAIDRMKLNKPVIYHLQMWSANENEYHHLAKNTNLNKIVEAGIHCCRV